MLDLPRAGLSVSRLIGSRLFQIVAVSVGLGRWGPGVAAVRSGLAGRGDTPNGGHDRELLLGCGASWRPVPETTGQDSGQT